jgi:N-acyl-D-amino-acid deacylase
VRERPMLSLEAAVHKMTGLTGSRLGLRDRGTLCEGHAADIVVFDAARIGDRASFDQPTEPAQGVVHVMVNGRFAVRNGAQQTERAGRRLTRLDSAHTRGRQSL